MDFDSFKDALKKAKEQVKEESEKKLTPEEIKMNELATKLLLLERDLKASGLSQTSEKRIERILDIISREL